jgi:hydroxymethylpyrimidine pyrophosphatase-like HAD family hydrolase
MHEREFPHIETGKPIHITHWAILDLDGVILRWVKSDLPNQDHHAQLLKSINTWQSNGLGIAVLTNRPPGAMPAIAYELGINYGTWVTESGGSLYDVNRHTQAVHPKWIPMLPQISRLRQHISTNIFTHPQPINLNEAQFEPGMGLVKTVIIPPRNYESNQFLQDVILPGLIDYNNQFTFSVGKAIDIDPIGLSKSEGMETLLIANHIDPRKTPTILIADHTRDIAAAATLISHGGIVGAVGNSSADFYNFTLTSKGITAPLDTSYHSSVISIMHTFLNSNL